MPQNLAAVLRCREPRAPEPAPVVDLDPVTCEQGRVYARRTVRRGLAMRHDSAYDRRTRWL